MDPVSDLENAVGAELLRAALLRGPPPSLARRYVFEKILGRGASGLVVGARDDRLGRSVAIKLRPAGDDASMLAEARALARLDHPNVVRVHDVDIVEAIFDRRPFRLWMVSMQRVAGRTLRTWLAEKPRSHEEILDVYLAAGRAIEAAHSERIVHRDFKPDNVLVRTDGVVQVIDFGFAVPAMSSRVDQDLGFGVAGTDAYMSPEAKQGRPTAKSDQYAFAIALVEALTGSPTKPGLLRPSTVPRATWRVVRRATRASRARYPDMTALLRELDAAKRPSTFWRRARWIAFATVVAAGGVVWAGDHPETIQSVARRARIGVEAALSAEPPAASVISVAPEPGPEHDLDDAGTAEPSPPDGSAAAASGGLPGPGAGTEPSAPPSSAGCRAGHFRMQTRSERNGLFGCYELELVEADGACRGRVRKRGSGPSQDCWDEQDLELPASVDTSSPEGLVVEAQHPDRFYRFVVPRQGTTGRFSTTREETPDEGALTLVPASGRRAHR